MIRIIYFYIISTHIYIFLFNLVIDYSCNMN